MSQVFLQNRHIDRRIIGRTHRSNTTWHAPHISGLPESSLASSPRSSRRPSSSASVSHRGERHDDNVVSA